MVGLATGAMAADRPVVVDYQESRIKTDVKAAVGSFVGYLARYDVTVGFDGAAPQVTSAALAFRFTDMKTGEDKRDKNLHDWQETEKFPDGRFKLSEGGAGPAGGYVATGSLTFHGVTQPVQFPVQVTTEGEVIIIDGEVVIDTQKFGLPIIRLFFALKVNPEVTVFFHLQGRLGSAGA